MKQDRTYREKDAAGVIFVTEQHYYPCLLNTLLRVDSIVARFCLKSMHNFLEASTHLCILIGTKIFYVRLHVLSK